MKRSAMLKSVTGIALGFALLMPMGQTAFAAGQSSILKMGSRGQEVVWLQEQMKALGYFKADTTGYYGSITKKVVMDFQGDNQLKIDGIVGPNTYNKLVGNSENNAFSIYKKGSKGGTVTAIQDKLKELGYFTGNSTGYYGDITRQAVIQFQKSRNLAADGVVGPGTYSELLGKKGSTANSRGDARQTNSLISWFNGVENIFARNSNAVITDIQTGIKFSVQRTGGYNHADAETLTKEDTNKLLKIYKGKWNWSRRAVIVEVNGIKIAASMAGMPHEYDRITGNGMKGHFDIHFLNSKSHGTNQINQEHQKMVRKAAEYLGSK